ncbi:MAG: zf-HC2 domain-containing protein [Verrucomicrobia bacterium]|nr:zf-HC2 domain-containing protein [Verrucomicrobiota bacterium]
MKRVLPSCEEITGLLSDAMDGKPSSFTRWKIRVHLAMCRLCRRYDHQLRLIRRGASLYAETELKGPGLPEALKAQLKRFLAEKTNLL